MIIQTNEILELCFVSTEQYANPFMELELDFIALCDGKETKYPCYWAGGDIWKARVSFGNTGEYICRTECSDKANKGLNGNEIRVSVIEYTGVNLLKQKGRLRISDDKRHIVFGDGTPFTWLGDTWWMGLTRRLRFPEEFGTLALDRRQKGFTLVQIVAGIYPDMDQKDARGENEAGHPWTEDNSTINPAYFDYMDRRIAMLPDLEIVPCIVACWGYYAKVLGAEKLRRYWRNLIARYGAYSVVWCLCGEVTMPYYDVHPFPEKFEAEKAFQKQFWSDMARYVKSIEPYGTLLTAHPSFYTRDCLDDPSLVDFEMLQSGAIESFSYNFSLEQIRDSLAREPKMPVVQAEVCYEGIIEGSRQEAQRQLFWTNMLSGAAGYTYGANGIWQLNSPEWPYGPSPHGASWGTDFWSDSMNYIGSKQVGMGKELLCRLGWQDFEAHPEWVTPHRETTETSVCFAAGTDKLRVIYAAKMSPVPTLHDLSEGWTGILWDPSLGTEYPLDDIKPDEKGDWLLSYKGRSVFPVMRDWVIVLKKK